MQLCLSFSFCFGCPYAVLAAMKMLICRVKAQSPSNPEDPEAEVPVAGNKADLQQKLEEAAAEGHAAEALS